MSGQKDRTSAEKNASRPKAKGPVPIDGRGCCNSPPAGVFLAIIVVVVVIIVAGSGSSSGGDAANVVDGRRRSPRCSTGLPQEGDHAGPKLRPGHPFYEYGDLQCPYCKEYSETYIPKLIEKQVKNGELKIVYRDFIIIGEDSIPAGEAALAAGEQGKGWDFIELFYRNQGEESSGYVTEEFIEAIGESGRNRGHGEMERRTEVRQVHEGRSKRRPRRREIRLRRHAVVRDRRSRTPRAWNSWARRRPSANSKKRIEEGQLTLRWESGARTGARDPAPPSPLSRQVDITRIIVRWI